MPVLMLISGYMFYWSACRYNPNQLFIRKVETLTRAIVCGSIFLCFFTTVLFEIFSKRKISSLLNGGLLSKLGELWFLWSVLAASVVMCLVVKYAHNWFQEVCIIILGVVIVALFPNFQMNLYMYPYFVIGYYFAKYKERIIKLEKLKYLSIIVFPIMLTFYEKKHFIYTTGIYGVGNSLFDYILIDSFRWLIGLVGAIFVFVIVDCMLKIHVLNKITDFVAKAGKKSLQLYVLSVVFLSSYLPITIREIKRVEYINGIYKALTESVLLYDFVFTMFLAFIYVVGLLLLIRLMERLKVSKYVFGR